jgi:uncharacterized protein YlxP (DUF503 family)
MTAPGHFRGPSELYIGVLRCSFRIPQAFSLKDRRRVVRSIQEKLQHHKNWNLSVIDLSEDHLWNLGDLAMVSGGISYGDTLEKMQALENRLYELEDRGDFSVISLRSEVFEYGKHTHGTHQSGDTAHRLGYSPEGAQG